MDEQFCDLHNGITLCYETFGEPSDPTALLIMGLGTQMVAWHEDFCRQLAGARLSRRALRQPRHRPLHARAGSAADDPPAAHALQARRALPPVGHGRRRRAAARRAGPRARARDRRVDGRHDRADARRAAPRARAVADFDHVQHRRADQRPAGAASSTRSSCAARWPATATPTSSTSSACSRRSARAGCRASLRRSASWRRSATNATTTPPAPGRQLAAIIASGDRTAELREISAPTLVVHGTADPLVRPSGGRATARAIKGAKLKTVQGMGHDLPRAAWPEIIDAIADERGESGWLPGSPPAPARLPGVPVADCPGRRPAASLKRREVAG